MLRHANPLLTVLLINWSASAWASTVAPIQHQPQTQFNINETQQAQPPASSSPLPSQSSESAPLELNSEQLLAQPDLLKRAMFSALMMRQIDAVRELLPIYRRLPENLHDEDTPVFLKLGQAQLAQFDGKYNQAIDLYEQILKDYPHFALARLSLAQSLFEDKYFDQAKQQFTIIQQDKNAPEQVINLTNAYLKHIDKQDDWQFGVGANYVRDNNINNIPKNRTFQYGGTWTLPEAESAQGFAYHASADKLWRLRDQISLKTSLSASGKFYWDNHKFDDLNVRLQAGLVHQSARSESAIFPFVSKRWYGIEPYSRETGLRGEWSYWVNPRHRVLTAAEYGREYYKERKHLDGKNISASATWLYISSPRQYFTLGSDINRKDAKDRSDAYKRLSLRGSWTRQWTQDGFSTSLSLDYGRRKYDAADFFNIVRKDKELFGGVSVWHNKIQYKGIVPRFTVTYQKVKSNHPIYSYHKPNAFIQLRKTF